jgi:hypothetical protein
MLMHMKEQGSYQKIEVWTSPVHHAAWMIPVVEAKFDDTLNVLFKLFFRLKTTLSKSQYRMAHTKFLYNEQLSSVHNLEF